MNCDYVTSFNDVIQQGATWRRTVFWTNPDGTPVILRGASARLQIRSNPGSSSVLLDLNSSDGSLVINNEAGSITWDVPAEMTGSFKLPFSFAPRDPKRGRLGSFDLVVTIGTEDYRIAQGFIDLSLGVTR